jgi:uncharacterized repeat protein (TIGR04138 family)
MAIVDFETALDSVLARDPRYARGAYHFVRDALDFTRDSLQGTDQALVTPRKGQHISGQELLDGARRLALHQFGPMTYCVLEEWGVRCCEDIGEIVFNLIDSEILSKTDQDSREDFRGGYNFEEAFRRPFARPG